MKRILHIALVLFFACAAVVVSSKIAQAQRVDFGFAVSGLDGSDANSADSNHTPVSLTGGTYLGYTYRSGLQRQRPFAECGRDARRAGHVIPEELDPRSGTARADDASN